MAGARGRKFPLDGAFAELRAEVEQTQAAMKQLREQITAGGGLAGGGGVRGSAGAAAATAANTQAIRDMVRFRDLMQSVSDLKQGIEGGRDLAKALGLKEASERLDHVAKGLDIADKAVKGVTGSLKLLGAAWKPVVVGVGTTLAGLVVLQRLFEATTGISLSLKETVQVMGLTLAKSLAEAYVQIVRLRLAFASEEDTPGLVKQLEDARANVQALQETIDEIAQSAPEAKPFESWSDELDRAKEKLLKLKSDLADSLGGVFGGPSSETRGAAGQSSPMYRAGQSGGVAYSSGLEDALAQASPQLNEQLLNALIVDPDDETRVINSFSDLLENLKNLFRRNPLGLITGFLGLAGGGGLGAGGGVGFATGGRVGAGGAASWAHFLAPQGFAAGGRPAGIAASDTVAAWLTPGEWVMRLAAVRRYGDDVMAKLNEGKVDPGALRAIASEAPAASIGAGGPGYASGGQVAGGAAAVVQPAIVANEQAMSELLAGGENALLRHMSRNASAIRGALGL